MGGEVYPSTRRSRPWRWRGLRPPSCSTSRTCHTQPHLLSLSHSLTHAFTLTDGVVRHEPGGGVGVEKVTHTLTYAHTHSTHSHSRTDTDTDRHTHLHPQRWRGPRLPSSRMSRTCNARGWGSDSSFGRRASGLSESGRCRLVSFR